MITLAVVMESKSHFETIGSPTSPSPSPASDHSRSSAPPPQFTECPPRPQTRSNVFVEVESDHIGEIDPFENAAANKGKKKRTSWFWT